MDKSAQDFLGRLVGAHSVSSSDAAIDTSNQQAGDVVAAMLEESGLRVTQHSIPTLPGKVNITAHAGPEQSGAGLLLAGHTDTVPCTEASWTSNPFELTERDGSLYGLGACDMKGFFAVVMQALAGIDLNALKAPLQVWATANEECGMEGAQHLASHATPCAATLLGEPTSLVPVFGHKGAMAEQIICYGKSGHASKPAAGANAVDAMLTVMAALRAEHEQTAVNFKNPDFDPATPTMNFGLLEGGDAFNRIPDKCRLWVDRRLMPGEDLQTLREQLRATATAAVAQRKGIRIEFEPIVVGFGAVRTDPDAPIVQAACNLTGLQGVTAPYATEAPYYAAAGMDVLVMGAGDIAVAHQPDECIAMSEIDTMTQHARVLIEQFCMHA